MPCWPSPSSEFPSRCASEALNQWLKALEFAMQDDNADVAKFDALIEANKRDFDAAWPCARPAATASGRCPWMELLEIIMRDEDWNGQAARKAHRGGAGVCCTPSQAQEAGRRARQDRWRHRAAGQEAMPSRMR